MMILQSETPICAGAAGQVQALHTERGQLRQNKNRSRALSLMQCVAADADDG